MLAVDEQGLNFNVVCLLPALPALDGTNYDELCWPLTVPKYALENMWVCVLNGLTLGELTW